MSKKKLTKADLGKTLAELGFKEGDELLLPSKKTTSNESTSDEGGEGDGEDGEGGGGNHPGKKPGN